MLVSARSAAARSREPPTTRGHYCRHSIRGASSAARASHRNLTTPGSGQWCRRQCPGNPGIGGTRHSRVGGHLGCTRATGVDINAGRSVSVHRVTVLLELTNGARVVAACPLPLLGPRCRTYVDWVRRFLDYAAQQQAVPHPRVESEVVRDYLTHLAVRQRWARGSPGFDF